MERAVVRLANVSSLGLHESSLVSLYAFLCKNDSMLIF